ncbi:MAG TPA: OmpH family outer membrane protein [Candidatus Eremiobacteraceae bacterium]|nr:OmpH family outer membrane protein [Candidatus Eremiobacteraceae bacterium]
MNSRNMIRTAVLTAACLMGTSALYAQAAGGTGKVGVVNVRAAIVGTGEGKIASAELQSQFAARQTELENLTKQINDLRQRLSTGGDKLSQEEQLRLQREGEVKARQLERKQTEYQEDVNAAQGDVIDRIGRKMIDVLDRYGRENGYSAIFDSSAQNSPILFTASNVDVTQDIVRLYDAAYPVKAGAATTPAAKPTPKPATPPATKPVTPAPTPKP